MNPGPIIDKCREMRDKAADLNQLHAKIGQLTLAIEAMFRKPTSVRLADRVIDLVDEGFDLAIRIGRLQNPTLV